MSDCPSRTAIVFFARRSTDNTDLSSCFSVVNPQRLHSSAPSFNTSMVPHSGQNSITPSFACPYNKGVWWVGSSAPRRLERVTMVQAYVNNWRSGGDNET
jgi:hypothetical protein